MKRSRFGLGACAFGTLLLLLASAAGAETEQEMARRLVEEYLEREAPERYQIEEIVFEGESVVALLTPASGVGEAVAFGFRIELGEIEAAWRLVGRLIRAAGGAVAESPPSLPSGEPAPRPTASEPVEAPGNEEPAEPAAPKRATVGSTPAAEVPPAALTGTVLLAAKGQPREFLIEAADATAAHLRDAGVKLEFATHGVGYMQDPVAGIPIFLEEVRDSGAAGLLFLTARFGSRETIDVECLDSAGAKLWRERVKGGLGLAKVQMNAALLARLLAKMDKRLGGPCLPTSG